MDKEMQNKANNVRELNLDELDQAVGGAYKNINTGCNDKAAVRKGPGKLHGQLTSIPNGTSVNTIGEPVWDDVSGRHFVMIEFYDRNGRFQTGWVASSFVGLPR